MTDQEILKKAIEKAESNGFRPLFHEREIPIESLPFRNIIFRHDFAKAFWGEERCKDEYDSEILRPNISGYEWEFFGKHWEAHLMMMVLEENVFSYLEKYL